MQFQILLSVDFRKNDSIVKFTNLYFSYDMTHKTLNYFIATNINNDFSCGEGKYWVMLSNNG